MNVDDKQKKGQLSASLDLVLPANVVLPEIRLEPEICFYSGTSLWDHLRIKTTSKYFKTTNTGTTKSAFSMIVSLKEITPPV